MPPIPAKRYFTIGEVSSLCDLKSHILRYWEQEFPQLKSVKRRNNRRYYQQEEILLIRKIRELLYFEGFTIQGANAKLSDRKFVKEATSEKAIQKAQAELPLSLDDATPSNLSNFKSHLDEILKILQ